MMSLLDAFDTVTWSETVLARLEEATALLARKQGLAAEKAWLDAGLERLRAAREGVADLSLRALRLPDLESVREEQARVLQGAAIDAVERLHAGITFHGGSRSPLLEALFARLKLPVLRRCDRADFDAFCVDFEKRLNTGYARRMFGDSSFSFVIPVIEQVRQAFAIWRGVFSSERLSELDETRLRDELSSAASRLDLPLRQARLLAEAALSPIRDAFESTGLGARPRRRTSRPAVTESMPDVTEFEAPDQPTAEEIAELEAMADAAPPEPEASPEVEASPEPEPEPVAAPEPDSVEALEAAEAGEAAGAEPVAAKPPRKRKPKAAPAEQP
jgi:hypothetical protein